MNIVSLLVVFVMVWTITLFMVLPFFKPAPPKDVPTGHASGAPDNPNLKLKFIITTIIALIAVGIYWLIGTYDLLSGWPQP